MCDRAIQDSKDNENLWKTHGMIEAGAISGVIDCDLANVARLWPTLNRRIRRAVSALVGGQATEQP